MRSSNRRRREGMNKLSRMIKKREDAKTRLINVSINPRYGLTDRTKTVRRYLALDRAIDRVICDPNLYALATQKKDNTDDDEEPVELFV